MIADHDDQDIIPAPWVVIGASGFVGKGITAEIERRGIGVRRVSAPRLRATPSISNHGLYALAEKSEHLNALISQFRNARVVINAAGMATPDESGSDALFGANAALPVLVVMAAAIAGVDRVVLLSSVAVQGNRQVLDESCETAPFSPYSKSKALGEAAAFELASKHADTGVIIVRATSVQGPQRLTTQALRRIARTPLASVASPGTQRSVVSSLEGLSDFVVEMADCESISTPVILIQPWEGATTSTVLELAGGKTPIVLPVWICKSLIRMGYFLGNFVPRLIGVTRRLQVMWFGQEQIEGLAVESGFYTTGIVDQRPSDSLIRALDDSNT